VDPDQEDKATEIKLLSFARPHMRAFHCSWWAFFIAFFIWFAITPLLSEIRDTLKLTKEQVWTSSIVGVGGTIVMRFILGPLCDKYGARILFAGVLCAASIPTACTGLIQTATGLAILRLFIGIAGGTFVMCQYWSSRMFTREVVGTANALCGGWGNLGGGVTQLVMGSALFPLFKIFFDGDAEKAWRTVSVVPAVVAFATGIIVYYISEDAPKGNYGDLKKHGNMPEISAAASFRSGAINFNTWLLFIQYGCCFGVELTMNNAAALYFKDEFGQSTESAAAIASIFGWMNLFARGLGGWLSDLLNSKMGMRGRLWAQTIFLAGEGALVLVFANSSSLGGAIAIMVFFSLFVQAAEGSTFGVVPYVDPPSTGSISGIVGAGGNVGAVGFGLGFRQLDYKPAFYIMGFSILGSAFASILINIKGHSALLWGHDAPVATKSQTLVVPEQEDDVADEVNA
jgi:NNP family nitrate/nitrite transporter-like MFS transporter